MLCFLICLSCLYMVASQSTFEPDPLTQLQSLGFPNNGSIRIFDNFVLSYDNRLRLATWVFEHLTTRSVTSDGDLTDFKFREDPSIHALFRGKLSDYKNNSQALTRGHLAAAANHQLSRTLKQNTYFLSNVAPQIGKGFNAAMWNRLEQWVRHLTSLRGYAYVITGPLFLPQRDSEGEFVTYRLLGSSRVAIPSHFFKAVLAKTKDTFSKQSFDFWTFVLPHQDLGSKGSLDQFLVTASTVEKDSGLLFFNQVPKNQISVQNSTKL